MRWIALSLSLLAATPALAQSTVPIGKVVLAIDAVTAIAPDGSTRRLTRGADIFEGERLVTADSSRLQVRMTDGSMVSLDPGSDFEMINFDYTPDAPENGAAAFELLKGGLRTFSGEVGKFNREDYQLKVSVATIGIRGTNYAAQVCDAECAAENDTTSGATGTVIDGAITVGTATETTLVDQSLYFFADDATGGVAVTDFPPAGFDTSATSAGAGSRSERDAARAELEARGVIFIDILSAEEYASALDISLEQAQQLVENGFVESAMGTIYLVDAVATPGGGGGNMGTPVVIIP